MSMNFFSVNRPRWMNYLENREHAFHAIKLLKSYFIRWLSIPNIRKTRIFWANVSHITFIGLKIVMAALHILIYLFCF